MKTYRSICTLALLTILAIVAGCVSARPCPEIGTISLASSMATNGSQETNAIVEGVSCGDAMIYIAKLTSTTLVLVDGRGGESKISGRFDGGSVSEVMLDICASCAEVSCQLGGDGAVVVHATK